MEVLPNFLIIGTPKAGTTSLYNYLGQHPEVYVSPKKEPRFFSFDKFLTKFNGPGDDEVEKIVVKNWKDYLKLFEGVKKEKAIGEASVDYLSSPLAPENIYHCLPQVKLIAILRNPVDRAYSNYLHVIRQGRENATNFETALSLETSRIEAGWIYFWHYAHTGFYYRHLKRYFDLFPKNQILTLIYEDFKNNNLEVMRKIFEFLEVDSTFQPNFKVKHNDLHPPSSPTLVKFLYSPHFLRRNIKGLIPPKFRRPILTFFEKILGEKNPQIPVRLRNSILEVFKEDIQSLQDLIQKDLSKWLQT